MKFACKYKCKCNYVEDSYKRVLMLVSFALTTKKKQGELPKYVTFLQNPFLSWTSPSALALVPEN